MIASNSNLKVVLVTGPIDFRAGVNKLGTSINRVIMQADCGFAVARVRRG